jgi:hypothetical protein
VRAHASAQASRSDTPQTVTQVSGMGSFEKVPTFFNILFDVQTLSQTKISSELLSLPLALFNLCSSAFFFFTLRACPATTKGIAAPTSDHQISPISDTTQSSTALQVIHKLLHTPNETNNQKSI